MVHGKTKMKTAKKYFVFFSRDKQCVLSLDKDAAVILLKYEKVTAKMKKHKNQIWPQTTFLNKWVNITSADGDNVDDHSSHRIDDNISIWSFLVFHLTISKKYRQYNGTNA